MYSQRFKVTCLVTVVLSHVCEAGVSFSFILEFLDTLHSVQSVGLRC